ncbi:GmrSD restriction endonuclease domain-containing protein [Bradyrhizobium diazoefficiens]
MSDGKLEIVDGSQRLRTLAEFVLGGFRLGELESLPAVSGFRFEDLPESRRRKIKNRSIRGIVLNEHADEQARFDMFERINTGSKVANKAEVRRGALAGPFMNLVIELAALPAFDALAPMSTKLKNERENEELVVRFFAYGDGLEGYKDRPSEFLFKYAKKMNALFDQNQQLAPTYRQRFLTMLDFVAATFPNGFRRIPNGKATPRARFEAIAIGSHLAITANPGLRQQPPDVSGWLNEEAFSDITGGDGANAKGRLQRRMTFVRDRLLGA